MKLVVINLVFLLQTKLQIMHLLLIDLARGLKYFDDVELTHGGDEDQVSLKYMKFQKSMANPRYLCTQQLSPIILGSLFVY